MSPSRPRSRSLAPRSCLARSSGAASRRKESLQQTNPRRLGNHKVDRRQGDAGSVRPILRHRGQGPPCPPDERLAHRAATLPLLDAFFAWARAGERTLSARSELADALRYTIKHNIAENAIRGIATGHDAAAPAIAVRNARDAPISFSITLGRKALLLPSNRRSLQRHRPSPQRLKSLIPVCKQSNGRPTPLEFEQLSVILREAGAG